jgi:hypothetical protein
MPQAIAIAPGMANAARHPIHFTRKPVSSAATAMPRLPTSPFRPITAPGLAACCTSIGMPVYESFESDAVAKTGVVPMPKPGEQVLGGQCVVAVGYDNAKRQFIVRNSWGIKWGQHGYCTMPYEYLLNPQLASDFWTLRSVKTQK